MGSEEERAGRLLEAQASAVALFDEVAARGIVAAGQREQAVSDRIRDLANELFGATRHWHKRIIRSGPNTLFPYRDNPPDRVLDADDIVFADFGPIFADFEADLGRTYVLGDDPVKQRLAADLPVIFGAGRRYFADCPDITGAGLYAEIARLADEAGWSLGGTIAGHLVGEFPHEKIDGEDAESYVIPGNDTLMRRHDKSGRVCHWILEIHLVDTARGFGGFYEQLLDLGLGGPRYTSRTGWPASLPAPNRSRQTGTMNIRKSRRQDRALAVIQCLALAVLALAGLGLVWLIVAGPALVIGFALGLAAHHWQVLPAFGVDAAGITLWAGLVPAGLTAVRPLANLTRRLSAQWSGVPIAMPYEREPAWPGVWRPVAWLRTHPATRRDLGWLAASGCLGGVILLVPVIMVIVGLVVFIGSRVLPQITPPQYPGNTTESILIAGTVLTAVGLYAAPWMLRAYGVLASSLRGPAGIAELERRVRHLSQTRTETIDAGAAEIRRIERDLHDGAQARLVAMGMTLDAAGHLIDEDPKAARALLIEARDNSAKALRELRELVRGIHPPVLADRGLAEAIKALALDTPLCIHLTSDLGQAARLSAPIESAAYFAVTELVANVTKHARASQAWIDIRQDNDTLKIVVADDGQGGADPACGSGLRGIERRLAAFDGVLAVTSPPGGPTAVTLEISCALS